MKIHRFWLDSVPQETESILTQKELIHQVKDVLQLKPGELIQIFNRHEEKQAELLVVSKHQLGIKLKGSVAPIQPPIKIHLALSLLKGDSWDDVIRSCVALGIVDIQPLVCERSIVRELTTTKLRRYQTIAKETVEQSGWNLLPPFLPIQEFSPWAESVDHKQTFLLHQTGSPMSKQELPLELTLVVGPEGGWTAAELDLAKQHHLSLVSISPATLTARLAPVVACAEVHVLASQK